MLYRMQGLMFSCPLPKMKKLLSALLLLSRSRPICSDKRSQNWWLQLSSISSVTTTFTSSGLPTPGGFARILDQGAVFTNAYYEHFPTVTAVGHSTILSGATPSISGIVGNEWFDRETGKQVTSVSDETVDVLRLLKSVREGERLRRAGS